MHGIKKNIFGIHGGGNIGLGLLANVISDSPHEYQIIATSNNQFNASLINCNNRLWLKHQISEEEQSTCISNVKIISRESNDIIDIYTESIVAAICLTPSALSDSAKDIALGLINRYETSRKYLKILILMNLPNPAKFVLDMVSDQINLLTNDAALTEIILSHVEFVPTVIDRVVTSIPKQDIKSQLKSQIERISPELLSQHLEITDIDTIINDQDLLLQAVNIFELEFHLFCAEKSFSMYVPNHFTEAERFPLMTTTKNLNTIEAVKNKYINGPHAVLAWIGGFLGHTTIADSIKHPELFQFIKEMMEYEIAPILIAEYPDLTSEDLIKLEKSFFERCAASINDPVTRVGRDPLRKLDSGGRIRGTIELARKHDLSIATPRLEKGIAAGLLYALHGVDPSNPGCKKIREIYNQNDSYQSVLCYSGDAPSGKFSGLHPEKDSQTIANVLNKMSELNRWKQKFRALARSFLWPIPGQHTGRNQNFEAANMNNSLTMKQ